MEEVKLECPNCEQIAATRNRIRQLVVGSPIIECPHCGHRYRSKHVAELGFRPEPEDYINSKLHNMSIMDTSRMLYAALGLTLLAVTFYRLFTGQEFSWVLTVVAVLLTAFGVFSVLRSFKDEKAYVEEMTAEYKASLARLEDPAYVQALIDLGCPVPDRYLSDHSDNSDN